MKSPAELFRSQSDHEKQETKRRKRLFFLPRVWGESPIWADVSRPSQLQVSADSAHLYDSKV
ncbi:hypothetical protein CG494_15850 [Listeria monocytogenes]|nr:hypothetical protein [Listeria monocytogenes]HAB8930785.1 hypothetical protein [Listeria monocytogenes]